MLACGCPGDFPDWHNQDINLGGQLAHILPVPMFLHMPLGFELHVARQRHKLDQLGLKERWPGLVLTRSAALRGQIIRLLEEAISPARHLLFLPNPYHLRGYLHEGGMDTVSAQVKQVQRQLLEEGRRPQELYLCYLTCPTCSVTRGNKILLLRRWQQSATLKKRAESAASRRAAA